MHNDIKQQFSALEAQMMDPANLNDSTKMATLGKQYAELKNIVSLITELEKAEGQIKQHRQIITEKPDQDLVDLAMAELPDLQSRAEKLTAEIKTELHPANPLDKKEAIMEIRAGAGGDEAALFAAELFRMYSNYASKQGWKIEVVDSSQNGLGGFKEIIFEVHGRGAYGQLKYEAGTQRVQRVPETEKAGRVHTSTVTVVVLPEAEEVDLVINPADLRIDTFCSSGPGGQSVNTTYSAIRILHLPTGMIVSCQDQKSQHQNKEKALQVLRSRLLARAEEERRTKAAADRKEQVGGGDRADKIRTYNFPQDRITDHRIGLSLHSIKNVMEGDLDELVTELKKNLAQQY